MNEKSQSHCGTYVYPARTRYIPLMVTIAWICAGFAFYVAILLKSDHIASLDRHLVFLAPWLILTAVGLLGQLSYNKRLKTIELTAEGLWIGGGPGHGSLIRWDRIERAERLVVSARGSGAIPSRGGIFIWENGQFSVIYEQIEGFEDLWRRLQERLGDRKAIIRQG